MAERSRQLALPLHTHGGRREGAGRKPGPRPIVPRVARHPLASRFPVHVTLRVLEQIPSLREEPMLSTLLEALAAGADRLGMRVVQYSIQGDHLHLLVEWRLSSSGAGPWTITSQPRDLSTVVGTYLDYSFSRGMSNSFTMSVLVSSNDFTNCDDDNWGTCRLVRQYPYSNASSIRDGSYRTETIDISDFDGQQNVKVRFTIGTAPNPVNDASFRVYDVVMVAR